MSAADLASAVDDQPRATALPTRLRALVAVHFVLAMAPAAVFIVPSSESFFYLRSALVSVWAAPFMLLSFWAGMGTARLSFRVLGGLVGAAYLAAPWIVGQVLRWLTWRVPFEQDFFYFYGFYLVEFCADVLLAAGILAFVRRRYVDFRRVAGPANLPSRGLFQYSMLQLLLITCFAAIVLALARSSSTSGTTASIGWPEIAGNLTLVVSELAVTLCAAWAALSAGRVGWRVVVTMLVVAALAAAQWIGWDTVTVNRDWRDFLFRVLYLLLPSAIVVASLIVVRSCGYRLVPKAKL